VVENREEKKMNRRDFLGAAFAAANARSVLGQDRAASLIAIAESLKPKLQETVSKPVRLVKPVADASQFLQWRMEPAGEIEALEKRLLKRDDSFVVDFGRHLTGKFSFQLSGEGEAVDSPVRLKVTFGEVPGDMGVPMESYTGALSKAWLPDEIANVDFLPRPVEFPRRHAFRYVKVDVIDTSPNFSARFSEVEAHAFTSSGARPARLGANVQELLRQIDEVSLNTLQDCMQTVFEDGPRRDRRLWVGDLRLQALTNYVTFNNYDLVKRCLYLFGGLTREDGLVAACVYDDPKPLCGRQYIMDYSALYGAAVADYVRATGDRSAARDLWPVVRRQMEILGQFVNRDGLFADPGNWWLFIDWSDELDRNAPMQAVLVYGYRQALEVARLAGAEREAESYADRIARMTAAARATFYEAGRKVFTSGPKRQVSWATQAWMIHAGIAGKEDGATALRALPQIRDAVRPRTPYLYHYVVDAMLECGMKGEALDLIRSYWGGMVKAGADTFWEVYDPADPGLSPYKSLLVNSYCHAWSCTPAYFLRGRGLI
jgi:alpha-L-rhamnosidase